MLETNALFAKKKGFTLVELIVVITILVILGSISFLSYQGFTRDARNAKRTSDLQSIDSVWNVKTAQGMSIFIGVADASSTLSGGFTAAESYAGISISGYTGATTLTGKYLAGNVNYTALGMKRDDFLDPKGPDYKMGATLLGNRYQIAATMEWDNGKTYPYLVGNWRPRKYGATLPNEIEMNNCTGSVSNGVFTLSDPNNYWKFYIGDSIDFSSPVTITGKSPDGSTLYLNNTSYNLSTIGLTTAESDGLIKKADSDWPVKTGGIPAESFVPYTY